MYLPYSVMLDKGREKYLFWGFQAVFFSVVIYSGMYFYASSQKKSLQRCYSSTDRDNPLHNFMKTLDSKHIRSDDDASSDNSEDYTTDTTTKI